MAATTELATTNGADRRPTTVYEPSRTGLPKLRPYFRQIWRRRPLIFTMARSQLRAEHYGSFIGQLWLILDPLLLAAVYLLLRTVVRPAGTGAERADLIAHLIMGIFFFQFTSTSFVRGATSILSNRAMVLNTSFPRAIFPIVTTLKAFLNFLPNLVVLFVVLALLGQPFTSAMLMIPLVLALQTVFNLGCALIAAPLPVLFRDAKDFLPYLARIWFFTSPVLYTVHEIPENIKAYLRWNPMYSFLGTFEEIFDGSWPPVQYVLACAGWAAIFITVGWVVFLLRERDFAVRL